MARSSITPSNTPTTTSTITTTITTAPLQLNMSPRLVVCLATLLSLGLWQMQMTRAEAAYTPVYDQQVPLKFGRRGLNPNVNSLFFGKRGTTEEELSHVDLGRRCVVAMSVCNAFFESKSQTKR